MTGLPSLSIKNSSRIFSQSTSVMAEAETVLSAGVETVDIEEDVVSFTLELKLRKKTKQQLLKKSNVFSLDLGAAAEPKEEKKLPFENITPPHNPSNTPPPPPPAPQVKSSDSNFEEYRKLIGESSQQQQEETTSIPFTVTPIVLAKAR